MSGLAALTQGFSLPGGFCLVTTLSTGAKARLVLAGPTAPPVRSTATSRSAEPQVSRATMKLKAAELVAASAPSIASRRTLRQAEQAAAAAQKVRRCLWQMYMVMRTRRAGGYAVRCCSAHDHPLQHLPSVCASGPHKRRCGVQCVSVLQARLCLCRSHSSSRAPPAWRSTRPPVDALFICSTTPAQQCRHPSLSGRCS